MRPPGARDRPARRTDGIGGGARRAETDFGKLERLRKLAAIARAPFGGGDIGRAIVRAAAQGEIAAAFGMARTAARRPDLGAEKILSRRYRFVWICNPKAASRSLIAALRRADPEAEVVHGESLDALYAARPEARGWFSFAFMRHPFDRTLSYWWEMRFHRRHPDKLHDPARVAVREEKRRWLSRFHGVGSDAGFDDFSLWLNTPWGSDAFADRHFLSQRAQICRADGRPPDFIGRFETLEADFRRAAARIGMPAPDLPALNAMAGWRVPPAAAAAARDLAASGLTARNKALIARRYAEDFALGGYDAGR